jgi:integrase/recombinase XerD
MLDDYAKHLAARHLTPGTITNTLRQLRSFMHWRNDDDWRNVTLHDLTGWHDSLLKQALASNTRCCKVWAVKRFLGWLHQRRHILTNPAAHLPPLHKTKPLPRGILTPEQLNSLVNAPSTATPEGIRDRAIFELLYSSGLRSGELCKLTLYALDRPKRLVTITQGKGRKDRLVPVGHIALEWLTRYLTESRPALVAQAKPGPTATLLFLTKSGHPFTPSKLLHLVRSYAATHNLPASTTTHSLRHACATGMLRGGASIRHVQEMLGHSSIKTTQIYTHIVKDDLKAIHAKTAPSERRAIAQAPAFEFTNWRPRKQKKPRATRKKGKPRKRAPKKNPPESSSS